MYPLNKYQIPERGARMARRDDRAYREYVREEQRRQPGCPARKLVVDQRIQATSLQVCHSCPQGEGPADHHEEEGVGSVAGSIAGI